MKRNITITILLAAMLLSSCGGSTGSDETTETSTDGTTAADTLPYGYVYPEADYEDYEFSFLNIEQQYWANVTIAPEEATGDLVNDAQFERNSRVEERFNIDIVEYSETMDNINSQLMANVAAGDDIYDTYIVALHNIGALVTGGYLVDLNTVSTIQLDKPWWDQKVNDAFEINNKLMLTTSDISFFPFEATWAIFFNEDTFNDLGLELPYDSVREGTWTLDKLIKLAKAGASLNGDDAFTGTYDESKKCRYGLGTHTFVLQMVHASGESYVSLDGDSISFNADGEKFFTLYEKIAELITPTAGAYLEDTDKLFDKYESGRLMMFGETLGYLSDLRASKSSFGVLPFPKYDEEQDEYYSLIAQWGTGVTTIATTAEDLDRTGVILDALAYLSYTDLMEPYYETYLTQKGVRNDDSVEMLQIIRENRSPAIDMAFGWTSEFNSLVSKPIKSGNSDVASIIAANKARVISNVESTLKALSE